MALKIRAALVVAVQVAHLFYRIAAALLMAPSFATRAGGFTCFPQRAATAAELDDILSFAAARLDRRGRFAIRRATHPLLALPCTATTRVNVAVFGIAIAATLLFAFLTGAADGALLGIFSARLRGFSPCASSARYIAAPGETGFSASLAAAGGDTRSSPAGLPSRTAGIAAALTRRAAFLVQAGLARATPGAAGAAITRAGGKVDAFLVTTFERFFARFGLIPGGNPGASSPAAAANNRRRERAPLRTRAKVSTSRHPWLLLALSKAVVGHESCLMIQNQFGGRERRRHRGNTPVLPTIPSALLTFARKRSCSSC